MFAFFKRYSTSFYTANSCRNTRNRTQVQYPRPGNWQL